MNWKTEKRLLGDLIPSKINPRILTETQKKDLLASLDKFSLAEIPAINTNNNILAGHQRVSLLIEKHGEDFEIDVRVPDEELSESEEREYIIRSNKNTGEFDFDLLHEHFDLKDLSEWGFDFGNFEPNVNPDADYDDVNASDIGGTQESLDNQFSDKPKDKRSVVCPHCLEQFDIDG